MKIVTISDSHGLHKKTDVPNGDMLIFAGDMTNVGSKYDVFRFFEWFSRMPHRYKVCIAGNHDYFFDKNHPKNPNHLPYNIKDFIPHNVTYLENSDVIIEGLKIWGSPYTPWFHDWAFNLKEQGLKQCWELIPDDCDILITHGPPYGYGDKTRSGENVGCKHLLEVVKKVKPKLHVFGHIHEGYGQTELIHENSSTMMVNASVLDVRYHNVNPPIVVHKP